MATQPTWTELLNQQGNDKQWYDASRGMYMRGINQLTGTGSYTNQLKATAINPMTALAGISPTAGTLGYGNLLKLLASEGRTDPRAMNAQMAQIQQGTQGAQMQQQGMAARQGFGNSGVNAALQAALGNAGNARQSDVRARDAQLAEERKRGDMAIFNDLIVNPGMQYASLASGAGLQQQQTQQQERAAKYGAYASLIGALAGAFCWVADAVLDDKMAVERCRLWMRLYADKEVYDLYREYGPGLAAAAKNDPALAAQLRPIFKAMDENVMERMAEDGYFAAEA